MRAWEDLVIDSGWSRDLSVKRITMAARRALLR
jgi:hypothetical protein